MEKRNYLLVLSVILVIFSYILSYISYILNYNVVQSNLLILSLFLIGIVLFAEYITTKFKNYSFFKTITKNKTNLISFIATSVVGGIALEAVAQWLGKLWFYPSLNNQRYLVLFTYAFSIYWLFIVESYLAVKVLLDYLWKGRHKILKTRSILEQRLYIIAGTLGIVITPVLAYSLYIDYNDYGGYFFEIQRVVIIDINFVLILWLFLTVWLVLELVEFLRNRVSLIKTISQKYYIPIIAIFVASIISALIVETKNHELEKYWVYANWPYESIKIFNLPLTMIMAWPLHYIGFLSLMRAVTNEDSEEIWADDTIK